MLEESKGMTSICKKLTKEQVDKASESNVDTAQASQLCSATRYPQGLERNAGPKLFPEDPIFEAVPSAQLG